MAKVYDTLPSTEDWNVFMYLGYLKMLITLTKYAPLVLKILPIFSNILGILEL